jgi:outer membrane lipoprotein SlyB
MNLEENTGVVVATKHGGGPGRDRRERAGTTECLSSERRVEDGSVREKGLELEIREDHGKGGIMIMGALSPGTRSSGKKRCG